MEIRILGAHNIESYSYGCPSFIIDGILAVEAGALTSRLSLLQQQNLKAILLTHHHYDHTKDIPLLGMSLFLSKKTTEIYATESVFESLLAHLLNSDLYPDFTKFPPEKPVFQLNVVEPDSEISIANYKVLPVTVKHAAPTVGYQITSFDGKSVFITSDTGPGLDDCWKQINPQLLITEMTLINDKEEAAHRAGHLTPHLLFKELEAFCKIKGYLPQVVLVHLDPLAEKDIQAEIREIEKMLSIKIRLGYEGMTIKI
jgi:ribonuclease BN (tRNA processing enzyme)